MPPEQAIKFRCDRCGQLLGVSPSRAGRPVKCPKCGAGLLVPSPGDPEIPSASTDTTNAPGEPSSSPSSGFFDAVDLDQDDLRNLFPVDAGEDQDGDKAPPLLSDPETNEDEANDTALVSIPPERPEQRRQGPIIEEVGGTGPESISALFAERSGPEGRSAELEPWASAGSRPRGARDVLVPRMALLAWSLFVLLALFLAFLAGLLVGHFVWKG